MLIKLLFVRLKLIMIYIVIFFVKFYNQVNFNQDEIIFYKIEYFDLKKMGNKDLGFVMYK